MAKVEKKTYKYVLFVILLLVAAFVIFPIIVVAMNSFKSKLFISTEPFKLPSKTTFVGFTNYTRGLISIGFFKALYVIKTLITVSGVGFISNGIFLFISSLVANRI